MSEETDWRALGEQALECGFRYDHGLLLIDDDRIVSIPVGGPCWCMRIDEGVTLQCDAKGAWVRTWYDAQQEGTKTFPAEKPIPDFEDAASIGVLTDQVRESWKPDVVVVLPPDGPKDQWVVNVRLISSMQAWQSRPNLITFWGDSEAEALLAALERSPCLNRSQS